MRSFPEKRIKNIAILETIRRKGPISRMDISKIIGINPVTVSNYIERYIKENIVFEKTSEISTGGRPPILVNLNPQAGYAIGVGINLFGVVGVIIDMEANIIDRVKLERPFISSFQVPQVICEAISELLNKNSLIKDNIKGIGVGVAGIVDKSRGTVKWPKKVNGGYIYESITFPLKEFVEKKFYIPTIVENDATCACFAEWWIALPQEIQNVIYMFSGVGMGLLLGGRIYTGSFGCAGEPSLRNCPEQLECSWAGTCILRRQEGDLGIVEEVKRRLSRGEDSSIRNSGDNLDLRKVFEAAQEGDSLISEVLQKAGERLGIKIAFLVNIFNPQIVVIGGGIENAGSIFMDAVQRAVEEWAFEDMTKNLRIVGSSLGEDSIALGGASLIVREVFANC